MTSSDDGSSADENKNITGDENHDEMSRGIDHRKYNKAALKILPNADETNEKTADEKNYKS